MASTTKKMMLAALTTLSLAAQACASQGADDSASSGQAISAPSNAPSAQDRAAIVKALHGYLDKAAGNQDIQLNMSAGKGYLRVGYTELEPGRRVGYAFAEGVVERKGCTTAPCDPDPKLSPQMKDNPDPNWNFEALLFIEMDKAGDVWGLQPDEYQFGATDTWDPEMGAKFELAKSVIPVSFGGDVQD